VTRRERWLLGSAVVGVAVYAALWLGVATLWHPLIELDRWALDATYRYGDDHPGWIRGWDVFCLVFGPALFRIVGLALIVMAFVRRQARLAFFLLASVELSGLVVEIAKHEADRPRPATALVAVGGTAFPSGHALGVIVGVLAFGFLLWPRVRHTLRPCLVVAGVLIVVAIGVGRVVLNVHHPSDVLAGWALGYAYFAICLLLVPPLTVEDEIPAVPDTAH